MKFIAYIFRFLLGAVFVFSGFVKAIDPLGTAYKFSEYFAVFNMQWLDPLALFMSIFMSAIEFIIGAALIVGIVNRLASWGGMLFMSFFTPLTLYFAIENPIADCGCFGYALIMTNWETFYKNLVLIIFAIVTFIYSKKFKKLLSFKNEFILAFVLALIPVFISIYGLRHLPIIDFRPWKVGNSMKIDTSVENRFYVSYKNKETGEIKEYLSPNFPWDDPEWVENWEFIGQRVVAAPLPENYFFIGDENGQDFFKDFTQHTDYQFFLIMYYIEDANLKNIETIKQFALNSFENNIDFIAITGSTPETVAEFNEKHKIPFETFYSDATTLKTIIRSNPGLVLIKDATILEHWSHRDIPKFEDIEFEKLSEKYITGRNN